MLYIAMVKNIKVGYWGFLTGHTVNVMPKNVNVSKHKRGIATDMSKCEGDPININSSAGIKKSKKICDALAEIPGIAGCGFIGPPQLETYMKSKGSHPGSVSSNRSHYNHIHFNVAMKYAPKNYMKRTSDSGYSPSTAGTGFYNSLIWDTFRDYEKAIGRVAQSRTTRTS
jgi:hypothetical protein